MTKLISVETVVNKIIFLRNKKVLLDRDLAELYGVADQGFESGC
jgi:hypothetical protein